MSVTRWIAGFAAGMLIYLTSASLDGDIGDAPMWGLVLGIVIMLVIWYRGRPT